MLISLSQRQTYNLKYLGLSGPTVQNLKIFSLLRYKKQEAFFL